MGGDWYCRANGDALFTVPKPLEKIGIGIDQLPDEIRLSKVLTGNELAMLANIEGLPLAKHFSSDANIHLQVKGLLEKQLIAEAWGLLSIR
jgi:hypothetical protein